MRCLYLIIKSLPPDIQEQFKMRNCQINAVSDKYISYETAFKRLES